MAGSQGLAVWRKTCAGTSDRQLALAERADNHQAAHMLHAFRHGTTVKSAARCMTLGGLRGGQANVGSRHESHQLATRPTQPCPT